MVHSRWSSVVLCLALAAPAWAVPIIPGVSGNAVPEPDPVGGGVVGAPLVTPLVGGGSFTATLTSVVIAGDVTNPLGGLTFIYQVANNPQSVSALGRLTVTGYNGWLTDMSYQPVGGLPPTFMDRSVTGDVIGYSFVAPPSGITALLPGGTSEILVVQTNAPAFTVAVGNVINGSIASGPAYAPIPEPATLMLLIGGIGLLLNRRR